MMKGLELIHLCRKVTAIPLGRGIHTDTVLFMKRRRRNIPDEPGIKHRRALYDDELGAKEWIEHEGALDDEVDMMNIDKAYDLNQREKTRNKIKMQHIITAKKFFAPRPQPLMLTCNERECIRHLHKQDPVHWNLQTLSESFPATTDTIKKIIKGKWKITPERAKILDSKAQKNWELLAEGKLDAEPHILEHFKKFVNRREVLLEQIKNENFYLPEVKKEIVWNKGDFSGVLSRYEKAVQKLAEETQTEQQPKMLNDGKESSERTEDKSSLDVVHGKICDVVSRNQLENKDSFLFGNVTKFYSKHTTLEGLENKILKQAEKRRKLGIMDKAILETKLGAKTKQNVENLSGSVSVRTQDEITENLETEGEHFVENYGDQKRFMGNRNKFYKMRLNEVEKEFVPPDERTRFANESEVGKLLQELRHPEEPKESGTGADKTAEESEARFSDHERLRRENMYYDNEVRDIENTAFWNNRRSSAQKKFAEFDKLPHDGPLGVAAGVNPAKTAILSEDRYPERIKIPKNKQRSGLTFKVKDCYYDDDGEFLYRVPGMTK